MSQEGQVREQAAPILPTNPARFFNREISWLYFNKRLLEEANNPRHPVLERLRFLSMSSSSLDVFYKERVARLHTQLETGLEKCSQDGLTPSEQLDKISAMVFDLNVDQARIWEQLNAELSRCDYHIVTARDLKKQDHVWLERYFSEQIFPVLTPVTIDPLQPFPVVPDTGVTLGLDLTDRGTTEQIMHALLTLPPQLSRFIRLENFKGESAHDALRFVRLETVVTLFINELFPGYEVRAKGTFRLLRGRDVKWAEQDGVLVHPYGSQAGKRNSTRVLRMEIEKSAPEYSFDAVIEALQVSKKTIYIQDKMVGLSDVSELIVKDREELLFSPFTQQYPERIRNQGGDIFAVLSKEALLVHHPYESFEVVVDFLLQAASDREVLSIKWMLYPVGAEGELIEALKRAAQAGKVVSAIIEEKPRFATKASIDVVKDLENAGVHVLFGSAKLKTHAQFSQIVRRERGKLKSYSYLSTSTVSPKGASTNTDLSYFTDNEAIARDVMRIFNYLTSMVKPDRLETMLISPDGIRNRLLDHIREEIYHARAGRPASIWLKMNVLEDEQIIDLLYEASGAGVSIDLIVRGVCCLRPGLSGLSENIRVKSIVGRFMEHARIYCFGAGHGLPSQNSALYISSADIRQSDFDRRVEIMVPVLGERLHQQIQDQIMQANLADTEQSWHILSNGVSKRFILPDEDKGFNAHNYFMKCTSLSGRGKTLDEGFSDKIKKED